MPPIKLEWTQEAIERANEYASFAVAEKAVRDDLELLYVDMARRGANGRKTGFYFHSVPMPGHGYEEGFTLTPIDETTIRVEPADFVTIEAKDIDMPIQVPDVLD